MKKLLAVLCLGIFALACQAVLAHSYQLGDIKIGHLWTRATPTGATTAAIYGPFLNTGKENDKLIGVTSALAEKIQIHENTKENNITKMTKLDFLTLEPNKPVSLKPTGIHLMVIGLKQPLKKGDMFPLTLQFEKAGSIDVTAAVEDTGTMSDHH